MPEYLVTVDPGLESIALDELRELVPDARVETNPFGAAGRLLVEVDDVSPLLALRTAHFVDELRARGPIASLDDARGLVRGAAIDELGGAESFRVSSSIRSDTAIDRIDLQRAAGGVLCERYGTAVDLEGYELDVRVDLLGETLVVGPRRHRGSLADRVRRGRAVRSSLKATTAAALLRLCGTHRSGGRLIDPMCGAGTIPLEATRINAALDVEAADWDEPTVGVAAGTFANHEVALEPTIADARTLGERRPAAYDFIVTDPPYGMRQGRRASLGELYRRLLGSFRLALKPGGTLGIVVVKHRLFDGAARESGLAVRERAEVDAGSVRLRLVVLSREP